MDDRHARHRRPDADRRRRPIDGFRTANRARFRRLVDDAILALPHGLRDHLDGVQVAVRDVPDAHDTDPEIGPAMAHYQHAAVATPAPPARLTVFRRPLEARSRSRQDLVELIREVVAHELADRLGIDDDGLDEPGWG